jgi:catechol 2,3-dioxygenase-like lactoylglutathione lyase family enzyme
MAAQKITTPRFFVNHLACLLVLAGAVLSLSAAEPVRPHVTGLSHVALWVHDVEQSRRFYKDFLGFDEPYSLTNSNGSLALTFIKINDRQAIELFPERETNSDRLYHISLETDDAEAMRIWLAAKGVKVPDKVGKGRIGNLNFNVHDPDGHTVEIVQYAPDGWTRREQGKFMPDTRISARMMHTGILVGDLDASLKFYHDILGGTETWRGGQTNKPLSWVNVKLADSPDYVEFMLYETLPDPARRGTAHHICLEVADVEKTLAILKERAERCHYTRTMEIKTGINRKRQINVYDPDGTRVELMEPNTVDGKPAPSSTAPPPKAVKVEVKPAP